MRRAAKASRSKASASGSGPRRAIPGTSCGSRTTYTARRFCVPASVRSKPPPPSSTRRSASGPLPGRGGCSGKESCQRSQLTRARWVTRWSSPMRRARNLPWRAVVPAGCPSRAVSGGSYVLSTLTASGWTRSTTRPVRCSSRNSLSASTSGNSGMPPACQSPARGATRPRRMGVAAGVAAGSVHNELAPHALAAPPRLHAPDVRQPVHQHQAPSRDPRVPRLAAARKRA